MPLGASTNTPPTIELLGHGAEKSIAYSDGRDVRFANVAKLERTPDRVCRGDSGAMVTSLAFDVSSPGTLYVGYDTGAVMVGLHDMHNTIVRDRRVLSKACFHPRDKHSLNCWRREAQ